MPVVSARGHIGLSLYPEEAVTQLIVDATARKVPMNLARAERIIESVKYFSSDGYFNVLYQQRGKALLKELPPRTPRRMKQTTQIVNDVGEYVRISPNYKGTLWRGLNVSDSTYDEMKGLKPGSVGKREGISSWTSDYRQAVRLGRLLGKPKTIIFRTVNKEPPSSASVAHVSSYGAAERQVLMADGLELRMLSIVVPEYPKQLVEWLRVIEVEAVQPGFGQKAR